MPTKPPHNDLIPVADIEISAVTPQSSGFVLEGTGADRAGYLLELHLDLPVDAKTRAVLAEMLAQSEVRVWRRAPKSLKYRAVSRRRPAGLSPAE